jgi:hypothetical protein
MREQHIFDEFDELVGDVVDNSDAKMQGIEHLGSSRSEVCDAAEIIERGDMLQGSEVGDDPY